MIAYSRALSTYFLPVLTGFDFQRRNFIQGRPLLYRAESPCSFLLASYIITKPTVDVAQPKRDSTFFKPQAQAFFLLEAQPFEPFPPAPAIKPPASPPPPRLYCFNPRTP